MSALGDDFGWLSGSRDGFLRSRQTAGGFDRDSADNRLAAADAAQHAPVTIGVGADASLLRDERVVVLACSRYGNLEDGAVFKG